MSWGSELWDQYENIAAHTQKGLGFLEKYGQFIKERSTIEAEYAGKLRKLVKHYMPKKKDEEDNQFTSCLAFSKLLSELSCVAGQHELVAENLTRHICTEVNNLAKEIKNERKRYLMEGAKLQADLQACICQLDKVKKGYEKAFKESEKAHDSYLKADEDLNLSRAEVEKAKTFATTKNQLCELAKTEYATQLQKTNNLQRRHFTEFLPNLFQQLQDMDERRTACLQNFFKQAAHVEKQVLPIISKCLDEMMNIAESVDPKKDSQVVIEKYKSGFSPQGDFPFEDLSCCNNNSSHSLDSPFSSLGSGNTNTLKGTVTGRRHKRTGLFGIFASNKDDFSDLPPNQRKKKLQQKIEALSLQILQETRSRDGLMNLKTAYESTPSLGDPATLEQQLVENGNKLDRLRAEQSKYQNYLLELEGTTISPSPHAEERSRTRGSSLSETDSLSRSASDSSMGPPPPYTQNSTTNHTAPSNSELEKIPNNHTFEPTAPSSESPESGIGINQPEEDELDHGGASDIDLEPLPVLGNARALYPFEATSEGSISIYEGEEFEIVELDQGDGWTRVRKANLEEGFVPSSYIECFLFNNC